MSPYRWIFITDASRCSLVYDCIIKWKNLRKSTYSTVLELPHTSAGVHVLLAFQVSELDGKIIIVS